MPNQAIRNLVFQGGSVKGVAYVGALEALAANAYLANVQRVAGTSAGSIFAALFALGCDIVRVNEILSTFDFKALLDDPAKGIPTQSKVLKSVEKAEHTSLFFAKIPAKTVKTPIAYRVLSQKGIYDGEFFRLWMEARIQEQVKNLTNGEHDGEHLTFAELHALTEKYPGVFRDLFVVGSNLTLSKKRVFSYDNPETEHVIISDAIRISMSIPNIFLPHHVHCKIDGQRLIDTKLEEWVDGGLYDNYPIDCFDHQKYMSSELIAAEDGKLYNPETLGFRLVNNERQAYYEGVSEYSPTNNVTHALPFNRALINAREALQEERYSRKEHIERTVYIDHLGISTLAFNLPESDQHALIVSGKEATERYFAKRKTAQNGCDESPSPAV